MDKFFRRFAVALAAAFVGLLAVTSLAQATHPHGADIDINIDIKPFSHPNSVNPNSSGVVPVALFGSTGFDVTEINLSTVCFVQHTETSCLPGSYATDSSIGTQFVNGDAYPDVVLHFSVQGIGIPSGKQKGDPVTFCVMGSLTGGQTFEGCGGFKLTKAT